MTVRKASRQACTATACSCSADAAPISVEQLVTRPIEEAVGVIPGVRDLRSVSRAGQSEVVPELERTAAGHEVRCHLMPPQRREIFDDVVRPSL